MASSCEGEDDYFGETPFSECGSILCLEAACIGCICEALVLLCGSTLRI